MTTTDDYARDLANRALGRQKVRDLMLKLHIKQNARTHSPVMDPRCAGCLQIIRGEVTAGNTTGKAIEKGDTKMKTIWKSKTVWLAILTILLGALEQIKVLPFLSPEIAGYVTMIVGALGFVVRLLTNGPVAIFKK